jgi:hypothetical protein
MGLNELLNANSKSSFLSPECIILILYYKENDMWLMMTTFIYFTHINF